MLVLLSACASGPRPGSVPARWRANPEEAAGDGGAGSAAGDRAGDVEPAEPRSEPRRESRSALLTVQEAVAEALAANRLVAQARLAALVSGTSEREARAALLPRLDASGRYVRMDERGRVVSSGISFPTSTRQSFTLDLDLSFPIFGFGRYVNSFRAARLSRQGAQQSARAAESDIAAAVTAAAFDLLEAIRAVGVARSTEAALEQQVVDSRSLLDAGRVTRAAVLEAQVSHDQARRDRERLESAIPIRRMVLNRLLGRPSSARTDIVDAPVVEEGSWELAKLQEEAVAGRPELRAAQLTVAAAERGYQAAVGAELPELRGGVNYRADDNPFTNPNDLVTLNVTLRVPIFTGRARGARIRRARYQRDTARLQRAELEDEILTEVATIHRDVIETFRDLAVAKRSIERSEESLRIQREKYASGRATSREVLDSTALLTGARFSYVAALYSYNVALRDLHRARGLDPQLDPYAGLERRENAAPAGGGDE